jgi:hypothetical protein
MKKLSVDDALKKGQQMINYPILGLMIIGFAETFYLLFVLDSPCFFPIGFVTTFVVMWLWWSFRITSWRIWAFENCRNVHELKRRAIEDKLIWPDGSRFEKTEIRNAEQRKRIKALESKFQIADEPKIVYDDGLIPDKTEIHYSKIAAVIYWLSGIGLFAYSFYLLIHQDSWASFLILCSIYLLYTAYKQSFLKNAPLILSSEGIQIQQTPFIKWEDVKLIENDFRPSKYATSWNLTFLFNKKDINGKLKRSIDISDLNTSLKDIELLIFVYQRRNKNNLS